MSAGAFVKAFYVDDQERVCPIRVQPETLTFSVAGTSNTGPGGPASAGAPRAKVSGGKRQFGVIARRVYFRFSTGAPASYKAGSVLSLPVLQPSNYAAYKAASISGATGTYLGGTVEVIGVSAEGGRG